MKLNTIQLREVIVKVWKRSPALSRIIHPEGFGEDICTRIDTYNVMFSNSYDSRIVDYLDINGEAYCLEGELAELMTAARKKFRDDMGFVPTREQQKTEVSLLRAFKQHVIDKEA